VIQLKTIYKYLPPERETYIKDELLRFTQPAALNDPFECIPAISNQEILKVLEEYLYAEFQRLPASTKFKSGTARRKIEEKLRIKASKLLLEHKKDPQKFRNLFFGLAHDKLNSKIGIFSLSRRWNSTLMWSHYCESHKGFCVGFDRNNSFFTSGGVSNDKQITLRPVTYSEQRVKIPTERGIKVNFDVMYTKSKDWEYEDEERMLGLFENSDQKLSIVPYDIHLFKVPHTAIHEIVIGANATQSLTEKILKFGKEKNISVYKATVSDTEFDMNRELL